MNDRQILVDKMVGENSIQSRALVLVGSLPIKIYPFSKNFDQAYGTTDEAINEVICSLGLNPHVTKKIDSSLYAISFPWSFIDQGGLVRVVDLYSFSFDLSWEECNPEWKYYQFKNRFLEKSGTGCETELILLGLESKSRRNVVGENGKLEDYLQRWPELGGLGPCDREIYLKEI